MFREAQQIGVYTLIRKLGQGGFGEVWLAENRDHSLTEKVAIKLPRNDQIDLQAVKEEIFNWTLSGRHKNILPIIECETFGNQIAIVSEFAADGSLQDLLKKHNSFAVADAVEIIIGILDGLAHLHKRKIIHRDLKPDNVLFQGRIPRLTDFGISRAMTIDSQSQTVSGTLSYMAPEAFDGKRNEQTDIWAVGVILYQLLTGNLPFPQRERVELIGALVMKQPSPLPDSIPPVLRYIVNKSLAKDSAERYQTANAMREELNNFCTTHSNLFPTLPTEPSIPINIDENIPETEKQPYETIIIPPAPPKPKSNLLYFAVPAVALLLFAIIGGSFWLISGKPNQVTNTSPIASPSPSITLSPTSTPSPIDDITLIPFRKGDKFGFSDVNKKIIIEPKYDYAERFSEGLAIIKLNGKYGFIDKTGKEIIPPKYDEGYSFIGGLAKVKLNWKFGFIDKTDNEIISIRYDYAYNLTEGLVFIRLDKKHGFMDKNGKEITPLKYDENYNSYFNEGLAIVKLNGKMGFVDQTGNEVISLNYEFVKPFSEGLAPARSKGNWSFIDKTGKEIIPLKYDSVDSFSEGLASVGFWHSQKYGFIDKTGKEIIPLKYNNVDSFSEGLASVGLDGKYGFIDKIGKEIIPLKYDSVDSFSEGLAKVGLDRKYGFIDKTGKEIIPLKYDYTGSFYKGFANVEINDKYFYIDKNGTEYYEP